MSEARQGQAVLIDNIRALVEARARFEQRKTTTDRIADAITGFTGSMAFVGFHAIALVTWLVINSIDIEGFTPFDPPPFVMLAMVASVEAIFLSTFVLVSQNRMQALADRRADLNLQISLLAERETTVLLETVHRIAERVGVEHIHPQIDELEREVTPQQVLDELEGVAGGRS